VGRKKLPAKCLICPVRSHSHGLCQTCLSAARRLIQTGKRTEQQLIDAGAMLPSARKTKGLASAYLKRLEKLEAQSAAPEGK
jgi:hypothetical protein